MPTKEEFYVAVGARIRAARRAHRLTQQALADVIGLSRASVVNIERGKQAIDLLTAVRCVTLLGLSSVDELVPRERAERDQLTDVRGKTRRAIERIIRSTER